MNCQVESARALPFSSATMFSNRLASLSHLPLSHLNLSAHNVAAVEENPNKIDEIRPQSKQIETSAEEYKVGPLTEPLVKKGTFSPSSDFAAFSTSLAKMQIWAGSNDTIVKLPMYHEPKNNQEFEQPRKIQALHVELNPEMNHQKTSNTGAEKINYELVVTKSKVEEPTSLAVPSFKFNPADVEKIHSKWSRKRKGVRPNSPSSNDENNANLVNQNLDSSNAWDPHRTQRLKRKHYKWAAIQAADRDGPRTGPVGGRQERGGSLPQFTRRQIATPGFDPYQRPPVPARTNQYPSPYQNLPTSTVLPAFYPIPGDIIITKKCREAERTNPYINPGGHVRLHVDQDHINRLGGAMRERAWREELAAIGPQFEENDLIIRAGAFDPGYYWIPQTDVEVFRYLGIRNPMPWLLYARTNFQPFAPPDAGATINLPYLEVHTFPPERTMQPVTGTRRGTVMGFRPEQTDLILRLGPGFSTLQVFYFHWQRTVLQLQDILIRPGYKRVEDSSVATVEMYTYQMHPVNQRPQWCLQGRDIQIYGGSVTIDQLIQTMDFPLTEISTVDPVIRAQNRSLAASYDELQRFSSTR